MSEILDQEKFNELKTIMGDAFSVLIETFNTDTQQNLANLRAEHTANNVDEVHRLAHSLKSTSANLGAMQLSEEAKTLEFEAKEGNLSNAASRIDKLDSLYLAVTQQIRQLI